MSYITQAPDLRPFLDLNVEEGFQACTHPETEKPCLEGEWGPFMVFVTQAPQQGFTIEVTTHNFNQVLAYTTTGGWPIGKTRGLLNLVVGTLQLMVCDIIDRNKALEILFNVGVFTERVGL